jgi:quercetin dioxygenase-like cupin family protein
MTKNMKRAKAVELVEEIKYRKGSIVSKTLLDKKAGSLTLFAFDAGQGLSEHVSPYDAVVQVLEGNAELTIGGKALQAGTGSLVIMPATVPHAVKANECFKMLLTMVR